MDDNFKLYFLYLFIFIFIILGIIVVLDLLNVNLNPKPDKKKLVEVITIEGFDNVDNVMDAKEVININNEIPLGINPAIDFCKSNIESNDMQDKCGKLTDINCKKTNCCVWLNNEKCVPGDKNGPTFKTNKEGNNIQVNNYYFNDKCYGKCS